jgi:hypothetical protein
MAAIGLLWIAWTGSALVTMSVGDGVIAALMSLGCCFVTWLVGAVALVVFFAMLVHAAEATDERRIFTNGQ